MDKDFKEYLCDFLEMYQIDSADIDFDRISNAQSMLKQLENRVTDLSTIQYHVGKIFDLIGKQICIYDTDYITFEQFLEIKDEWQSIDKNTIMRLETYIECFLLDRSRRLDLYNDESVYAMGNPYDLSDEECAFAEALMTGSYSINRQLKQSMQNDPDNIRDSITEKIEIVDMKFVQSLRRRGAKVFVEHPIDIELVSGGLLDRLCFYLQYGISEFCDKKHEAEICKIIYFFRKIEHTPVIPALKGKQVENKNEEREKGYFDLVEYLCMPSMENTSYPLSREKRSNGEITDYIKKELEKEIYQIYSEKNQIEEFENIKNGFSGIVDVWCKLLERAHSIANTDQEFNLDSDKMNRKFGLIQFDLVVFNVIAEIKDKTKHKAKKIRKLKVKNEVKRKIKEYKYMGSREDLLAIATQNSKRNPYPFVTAGGNPRNISPVAALYFKILRFEYLGEIRDRKLINSIEIDSNYDVPSEFIEEMSSYKNQMIEGDVEKYIKDNMDWLARYVYLKRGTNKRERDKIENNTKNISMMLDCCVYARRIIASKEKIPKLLVISCLQAIIQDEISDVEYSFYDYQKNGGNTHKVNFCIPQKPPTIVAHKLFLARQVEEHWYANLGKHEQYCNLREFENNVYRLLESIYEYNGTGPDISEMLSRSEDYYRNIQQALAPTEVL